MKNCAYNNNFNYKRYSYTQHFFCFNFDLPVFYIKITFFHKKSYKIKQTFKLLPVQTMKKC